MEGGVLKTNAPSASSVEVLLRVTEESILESDQMLHLNLTALSTFKCIHSV